MKERERKIEVKGKISVTESMRENGEWKNSKLERKEGGGGGGGGELYLVERSSLHQLEWRWIYVCLLEVD